MSRTLYVWCPDWPVIAAGLVEGVPVHAPVAVLAANRVVARSGAESGTSRDGSAGRPGNPRGTPDSVDGRAAELACRPAGHDHRHDHDHHH